MRRHGGSRHRIESAESWLARAGFPGERYTAGELARALCVKLHTVTAWIRRGWLRASVCLDCTYRIRRRSVRRLLADYPSACRTVVVAQRRHWRRWRAEHDTGVMHWDESESGLPGSTSVESVGQRCPDQEVTLPAAVAAGATSRAAAASDRGPTAVPPAAMSKPGTT